ncbi:hypothetical protein DMC25_01900 [Caulobacter sp. D4A]|uniref:hypothetical protein n=1 Tax=unclassified Caulobacter TaxID=2648921 RepID=UPI000D734598|nr:MULTISPECIES: hypothetical protein [unclassified Caulobacter]PXA89524.1 hypothetical protein DMC18_16745 [Caulobacter sp. D5]PXA94744.1 hypothetical protein DMC25_01900 [Caulobacter sp. D4A]
MSDGLSIGWSDEQARRARNVYRGVLGFNMFLHLVVGLLCMFAPNFVSQTVGLDAPNVAGWTRGWGATLILVTALYVPGLLEPVHKRAPNLIGILGRIWMGTVWVFCGGGFLWFALFDYAWALIIFLFYLRLFRAHVMTRP